MRAGMFGAATALLPCGLLYGIAATAAASGKVVDGAMLLGAFALGTVPALVFLQIQAGALLRRLSPRRLLWAQRGVALVAAGALIWRGLQGSAGEGGAPSCH
jgi:sulfite exporter TauE/SafE